MNSNYFSAFRILIFSFSFLLIFSVSARAQAIVPDAEIVREITAFAFKSENALAVSRPRISDGSSASAKNSPASAKLKFLPQNSTLISSLERRAFDLLNEKRIANNLSPLKWNEQMAQAARFHSENMARENYFSHTESNGSTVKERAALFGERDWTAIGENIAFNRGISKPVEMACTQWLQSAGHRENIMDKAWNESGIGVAVAPDGTYYFTQVFITK
ncbi:MAG: CAP domain-containing protein [Pyrinomonadaceae bacterium]